MSAINTSSRQLRNKNVSREIVISPYKVETYYLAHQDDFKVEDEIKLRMIVLNKTSDDDTNTPALAREILSQIKEGASFQQMASVYSQGSQRKQGGDWGWVERSVLRKELADVAFALKPGQVSDVIDTPGRVLPHARRANPPRPCPAAQRSPRRH